MKPQPWFWHGEEAAMFVGHEITKADALRLACEANGWDENHLEVHREFVVRDPENDHKGEADEAYKKCDPTTRGALAVTLVTS